MDILLACQLPTSYFCKASQFLWYIVSLVVIRYSEF